ncbi:MAG TPA: DedA family protein [Pseudonocardiaceae bacterium]|nr:DedA family protein [Pseudonocardiaceae bacterium]
MTVSAGISPLAAHPLWVAAAAGAGNPLGASFWLSSLGAFGVFLVLFAETGLLIGFFLPGDSLLFTAGLFCTTSATATVHLSLPMVLLAAVAGALSGAQVGFMLGRRGGAALVARVRNRHLHAGLERADVLCARYGYAKAIVLARFIPVVRTVLNPLAGILAVPTRIFTLWQIAGGLVWSIGVTLAGYALGSSIPGIDQYLLPVIALIVIVSVIPVGLELWRARKTGDGRGAPNAGDGQVTTINREPR